MGALCQAPPRAREEGLIVHELTDEVLIYDLDRHRSHCLSRTAVLIWRHCDGRTTVTEMAALLNRELGLPASEELVWLALGDLGKALLLQERIIRPVDPASPSRRVLLRQLGLVGGLALVTSIIAPQAAEAATCLKNGKSCGTGSQCCTKVCFFFQCICIPTGFSCSANVNCCSGKCKSGACT